MDVRLVEILMNQAIVAHYPCLALTDSPPILYSAFWKGESEAAMAGLVGGEVDSYPYVSFTLNLAAQLENVS